MDQIFYGQHKSKFLVLNLDLPMEDPGACVLRNGLDLNRELNSGVGNNNVPGNNDQLLKSHCVHFDCMTCHKDYAESQKGGKDAKETDSSFRRSS